MFFMSLIMIKDELFEQRNQLQSYKCKIKSNLLSKTNFLLKGVFEAKLCLALNWNKCCVYIKPVFKYRCQNMIMGTFPDC